MLLLLASKRLKDILIRNTKIVLCFCSVVSVVEKLPLGGPMYEIIFSAVKQDIWNPGIILSFNESLHCLCKEILQRLPLCSDV